MILKIELTDTEYVATQRALTKAAVRRTLHTVLNEIECMELDHLRTLLAEASVTENGRCKACDQTAERCTDWGGNCCPLCKHEKVST